FSLRYSTSLFIYFGSNFFIFRLRDSQRFSSVLMTVAMLSCDDFFRHFYNGSFFPCLFHELICQRFRLSLWCWYLIHFSSNHSQKVTPTNTFFTCSNLCWAILSRPMIVLFYIVNRNIVLIHQITN